MTRMLDPQEARSTCHDAIDYLEWLIGNQPFGPLFFDLEGASEDGFAEIQEIGMDLTLKFAKYCIALGDSRYAVHWMNYNLVRWADNSRRIRFKPRAQYVCALAQIAHDETNLAVFNLMQALAANPGNQRYDAAVDQLEKDLLGSTNSEHIMAMANMKEVVGPFRHRSQGSSRIIDVRNNQYPAGPKWVGSAKDWKAIEEFQNIK
ncbi:hypothetical protein ACLMJK_001055 [Lecanora helva]